MTYNLYACVMSSPLVLALGNQMPDTAADVCVKMVVYGVIAMFVIDYLANRNTDGDGEE